MVSACTMLFCHLWPAWLYHIYPHYFTNGSIFGKKLLNIKYALIFPTLVETFLILKKKISEILS